LTDVLNVEPNTSKLPVVGCSRQYQRAEPPDDITDARPCLFVWPLVGCIHISIVIDVVSNAVDAAEMT
jgi:hypothetical protein